MDRENKQYDQELISLQEMRFSKPIDLVLLEQYRVNPEADSIQEQIDKLEVGQKKELKEIHDQIRAAQEVLTQEIQKNTTVLTSLVKLTEEQRNIESTLHHSRSPAAGDDLNQEHELADSDTLLRVVEKNNETIDRLKEEIALLKRS